MRESQGVRRMSNDLRKGNHSQAMGGVSALATSQNLQRRGSLGSNSPGSPNTSRKVSPQRRRSLDDSPGGRQGSSSSPDGRRGSMDRRGSLGGRRMSNSKDRWSKESSEEFGCCASCLRGAHSAASWASAASTILTLGQAWPNYACYRRRRRTSSIDFWPTWSAQNSMTPFPQIMGHQKSTSCNTRQRARAPKPAHDQPQQKAA